MQNLRRNLGQRSQHVGSFQQIGARQNKGRFRTDNDVVQEDVEVQAAGSPTGGIAGSAAKRLDGVQALDDCAQCQWSLEANNAVDKVVTVESHGAISVPRRKARAGKYSRQLRGSLGDVLLGIDITPDGNVDVRHDLAREIRAVAFNRYAYVARTANRAGLVDGQTHPLYSELFQQRQSEAIRQRLNQLEFRGFDESDDALGDFFVVEGVFNFVTD